MGRTSYADIPGNVNLVYGTFTTFASNAAAVTVPIGVAPYNARVGSAWAYGSVTQAAVATKTSGLSLINLGSAGTGTVVLGSVAGGADFVSYKPVALTLATTPTVSAGDMIGIAWASAAATTISPVDKISIRLAYI